VKVSMPLFIFLAFGAFLRAMFPKERNGMNCLPAVVFAEFFQSGEICRRPVVPCFSSQMAERAEMSIFMILGMVCCALAASSTLLVGFLRSAPLVEDFDARPTHHRGTVSKPATRRESRVKSQSVRVLAEQAHPQVRRRAV